MPMMEIDRVHRVSSLEQGLTAALDALGACSQNGGCQRAKVGMEVLHREVNLAHGSVQHRAAVSPAHNITALIQRPDYVTIFGV